MSFSRLLASFRSVHARRASSATLALAAAPRDGRCLKFFPSVVPSSAFSGRAHTAAFRLSRTAGSNLGPTLRLFRAPSTWLA